MGKLLLVIDPKIMYDILLIDEFLSNVKVS
jgi:hypothetical protein